MRIPVPIVLVIAILAVAGFWWIRTKDLDFLTPTGALKPLPEFMTQAPDRDPNRDPTTIVGIQVANPAPTPPPANPEQPQLEFGDLESAPGLAEYSEHAAKGAGYLIRLATELEIRGQWERSLLAWERVIDYCHPSEAERQIAEDAVVRIRPTLTHWNIDPEGDLPILLQLGTSRRNSDHLKEATQKVAEFTRRDSDFTLLVTPRITTASSRNATEDAPIAIYFSGTGEAAENQSSLQSITPEGDDPELYARQIMSSCYQIVRQGMGTAGGIVPPRPASADPELDFQRQVTRLHWKIFADSITRPPANPGEN